jgi:hypothetical protein
MAFTPEVELAITVVKDVLAHQPDVVADASPEAESRYVFVASVAIEETMAALEDETPALEVFNKIESRVGDPRGLSGEKSDLIEATYLGIIYGSLTVVDLWRGKHQKQTSI